MDTTTRFASTAIFLLAGLMFSSCSPVMEATRPDPVDLQSFTPGETRVEVVSSIGSPSSNITDRGKSCDVYRLYTHGPGAVTRGAIAVGEAAADVVTLCLAEVVLTPAEAITRNGQRTVLFCYKGDGDSDKLAWVRESGTSTDGVSAPAEESPSSAKTGGITAEADKMGE